MVGRTAATAVAIVVGAIVVAAGPEVDFVDRPKPDWYHHACALIDGEDDPC